MGSAKYYIGDVFDVLATLPDNSVDLVFSSPPFLALRSYLPSDHPDKAKEIGSEATPADFLDTLLDVVEACDRVLAPHGSLVFELGDTFSGSGGGGGDYADDGLRAGQPGFTGSAAMARVVTHAEDCDLDGDCTCGAVVRAGNAAHWREKQRHKSEWPDPKSLCGIPTLFAWSLAYGRNLLRPERETPRWRIRNLIVWARPNPPVGALGDKFRPATSYLTVACKSDKRWFDLDSVRVPYSEGTLRQYAATADDPMGSQRATKGDGPKEQGDGGWQREQKLTHAGAPPLDYWEIPTQPFRGSHYATFPDKLVVKPVASMCPAKVCRVCGEPSRRITGEAEYVKPDGTAARAGGWNSGGGEKNGKGGDCSDSGTVRVAPTVGWTECDCRCGECVECADLPGDFEYIEPAGGLKPCVGKWRAGVVLDVFGGSGTTGAVATGHGRNAVLIDLDERNADLAMERIGPLMCEVTHLGDGNPLPDWLMEWRHG